jgi:lauroyl/myristoyl acyltransferase
VTGEQLGRLAPAVRRDKARRGIAVVRPADGMRALYRQLAANRIITLLIDGDVYWRGRPIDFLGAPAALPWGAVRLARSTGAALLAATMRRSGPGSYAAAVHPPVDLAGEEQAVMRALLAPLERAIAADPTQWCLFRPLWQRADPGRGAQ